MAEPTASYVNPASDPEVVREVIDQPDGRWTVVTETRYWRHRYQGCRTRPFVGDEVYWPKGSFVVVFRSMTKQPSLWEGVDD